MNQELELDEMLEILNEEDYDEVVRFTAALIRNRTNKNRNRIAAVFPEGR